MRFVYLLVLMFLSSVSFAQDNEELMQHKEALVKAHQKYKAFKKSGAGSNYDIIYHRLDIYLNPNIPSRYIKGSVTSYVKSRVTGLNNVSFDLRDNMTIDSIIYHGNTTTYSRANNVVTIDIPTVLNTGDIDSVTIYYEGNPHGNDGSFNRNAWAIDNYTLYTLSEPYGAFEWWPCKQQLEDKIDSIDIIITVPDSMRAASNGLLVNEYNLNDSLRVFHWKHRHPITTYLVAVSISVFEVYSDYYYYNDGNDSMEILNYVYPTSLLTAQAATPVTADFLHLFDSLFGTYPFLDEKYGHAQFGFGGGMEHQTMSFMGGWSQDLIAHELAHQWFGDYITCGTWADLWLNEGFADYLTLLTYNYLESEQRFEELIAGVHSKVMARPNGSLYIADTLNSNRLFDGRLTYSKGAMVVHMLRWMLGDDDFYAACREYIQNHGNGFALTNDLKAIMEQYSGRDLTEFFADWYFGEGYPTYVINWKQEFDSAYFQVNQTQSHNSVFFFDVPIPIQLIGETKDTIIIAEPTFDGYTFSQKVNFKIKEVVFDPNKWILAKSQVVRSDASKIFDLRIYPNPTKDDVTLLSTNLIIQEVEIVDILGRVIKTIAVNPDNQTGLEIIINMSEYKKGVYFFHIKSDNRIFIEKIVKS